MNIEKLKGLFTHPPMEYRSVPFWSWNDDLTQEELNHQVEGFKEQGMGGFMMHVREGLETPYLGEEFFDRIRETVQTAKKEGMYAWLYDEDRYSSGMGGGAVPRLGGDEVRAKALTLEKTMEFIPDDKIVAVYEVMLLDNQLSEFVLIDHAALLEGAVPQQGYSFLIFRREIAAASEWCHGDTYTDNLNPESIRLFLQSTHELYKKEIGEEFGKTVPGIFTDEPTFGGYGENSASTLVWLSWSDVFPVYFQKKNGYSIWEALPLLMYTGEGMYKARFDYWLTVTELFCESYTQQISNWCRENGLQFTGHFHSEASLTGATKTTGAVMPHYRYLDVPGIDTLGEQTDENLTIKQVSSVARQFGRKRVITETYGVTGWDFTFEGRRWLGDWQFVQGVNFLTHHLALYSLKGCRKRDYPPSFNYNNNWWEYNHILEDYYARLSAVLSQGEVVRDILVLNPVSSIWSMLGPGSGSDDHGSRRKLSDYEGEYARFINLLLASHYDYDLGDELIIRDSGAIRDGKFVVNLAAYTVVVLPPMNNIFGTTAELLREFLDSGGKVIAAGELPFLVDGLPSNLMEKLSDHEGFVQAGTLDAVPDWLENILPREVSIRNENYREAESFLYMLRDLEDSRILFVVNNDRQKGARVEISLRGSGRLEVWDMLTGTSEEVETVEKDGMTYFVDSFGPADSKLYVLNSLPQEEAPSELKQFHEMPQQIITALGPVSKFSRTAPNVLTLDRCSYSIGSSLLSETMDVWQAQQQVREVLGMRQVFSNGGIQRHMWVHSPHANDGAYVSFEFNVEVVDVPEGNVYLAIEQANRFTVTLNGSVVNNSAEGWFLDRSIDKLLLPRLKLGHNTLTISCSYMNDMEVEDCYLIGDFGVSVDRRIVKENETLRFGDWCLQGYLHYCGSIVYHLEYNHVIHQEENEAVLLELGEYNAVTVDVRINGQHAGHIPWSAVKRLDVSKLLVPGLNKIDIEVVGSPRNMLGPLHQAGTQYNWKEWWDYRRTGQEYTPEYVVTPYGLNGQVHIYRQKKG
ncbi:glycosyl hydrolase [Paenibacillus sp. FSL R10-2734]|uniref:glycosyl hydrolase n=1 Tax=Paenibacillus sp. FSL R10-2734 TaxID=2954691 RepID=UPI0030D859B0